MTSTAQAPEQPAAAAPDLPHGSVFAHRVDLPVPVARMSAELPALAALYVKEPTAGDLRGIRMGDLLQFDAAALIELMPRIARPIMAPAEIERMPVKNLVAFGNAVAGFLQ